MNKSVAIKQASKHCPVIKLVKVVLLNFTILTMLLVTLSLKNA